MDKSFNVPEAPPAEFTIPYDVIELPSQGLLYPNKQKTVKVEYLTALDETILTSPNIINNNLITEVLLERKIKELGFDPELLIEGDRTAILIFLRITGFGPEYKQMVFDENVGKLIEGEIDLSTLTPKKLTVKPDKDGYFDYILPTSKKKIRFKLLNGKDEKEITQRDEHDLEVNPEGISNKIIYRLERQIISIDGISDKIKISNIIKHLTILDSRQLRKYISDIEPGIDFKTNARTPGGASVSCFLRFGTSFFWPEL